MLASVTRHVLILAGLLSCAVNASAQADKVFRDIGPGVAQIRILDANTGSRSGAGSGFIIDPTGTVVTNYHVISRLVTHPGEYHAEYRLEDGSEGRLTLRAIDAIHDLALLDSSIESATPLMLSTAELSKGQRLYSLGNPYDIGLTIVEGNFNGYLEHSYQDRIHFTGAINPGMSGGPVVDDSGHVIGVNVATAGNHVGFLIPARQVRELIEAEPEDSAPHLDTTVHRQLLRHQNRYMTELLHDNLPTMEIGNFRVPGVLADWVECSGDTDHDEMDEGIVTIIQNCRGAQNLYLDRNQSTGLVTMRHEILTTDRLGPARFYRYLEQRFSNNWSGFSFRNSEVWLTGYTCRTGLVSHAGTHLKVAQCIRAYRPIEGLYDLYMTAASVHSDRQALRSTVQVQGVNLDNARAFSRAYLEAISWTP